MSVLEKLPLEILQEGKLVSESEDDLEEDLEEDLEDHGSAVVNGGPFYGGLPNDEYIGKYWEPLARFLVQLPRLLDFVYSFVDLPAPCLMDALRSIPNCRLHLHNFGLKSLVQPEGQPQDIDPYEYSVATCPQLYCILTRCSDYTEDGLRNYNGEAARLLAAGLAQNLKRVRVIEFYPGTGLGHTNTFNGPRVGWQGFFPNSPQKTQTQPLRPGYLDALSVRPWPPANLEEWSKYVEFSSLRTLKWNCHAPSTNMYRWMSTCDFSSLKTLVLNVESYGSECKQMDEVAGVVLRNLPPLNSLRLTGLFGQQAFQAIVQCHNTLRRLSLFAEQLPDADRLRITAENARELAENCAQLEELSLQVPRSQGNKEEVLIYRSLGSILSLRYLTIYLDCSEVATYGLSDSDVEEYYNDVQYPKLHKLLIREAMINAAVDEQLARAIYQEIENGSSNNGKHPALQCVKFYVTGAGEFNEYYGNIYITPVVRSIGRSWELIRNPSRRDDSADVVAIQELDREAREAFDKETKEFRRWNGVMDIQELVFREIWPEKTRSWQTDWHSFPLMTD
ncbi:hypothetical protein MGYG_03631 [Nannizzia gypsea CBS 118893]|uniref:F-box domain-containing protein n=1 Tax=Arthroderma gypseum (strain ATCC MYA-4604 / CBS 118893) TaxID=535722 RepID=E4UT12_ARTGP|nr:hypothetical protein MGYG_03631 [Nannizzia gypsea CBS 118893]EFR00625.1 hypothetical protein MGYG_03631 [Nannizzia gypsea CBS 118893]